MSRKQLHYSQKDKREDSFWWKSKPFYSNKSCFHQVLFAYVKASDTTSLSQFPERWLLLRVAEQSSRATILLWLNSSTDLVKRENPLSKDFDCCKCLVDGKLQNCLDVKVGRTEDNGRVGWRWRLTYLTDLFDICYFRIRFSVQNW